MISEELNDQHRASQLHDANDAVDAPDISQIDYQRVTYRK